MPHHLTDKQALLLRTALWTAVIYLIFQYLIPLLLPFLAALFLSILIRPVARFLYKKLHIPMGIAAGLVLAGILGLFGVAAFYLGRLAVEQLLDLWEQVPKVWQEICDWWLDCCGQVEKSLHLQAGTIMEQVTRWTGGVFSGESMLGGNALHPGAAGGAATDPAVVDPGVIGSSGIGSKMAASLLGTSLQSAVTVFKALLSALVTIFITIGATLITTTQLEDLKRAMDRSCFCQEIRRILDILARVGTAYGKTQLVVMACTVIYSAVGLTILGDPYALLWAVVIGLVDALPIFGAGTILWPWLVLSAFRGQLVRTIGLALIYAASNLTRQYLEARYMGDRIGLSALENLIAMYLGLKLFGILGLFLGPIGYLLIKESMREPCAP